MNQEHELELDLRQLGRALWRRKWIIIGLFMAASVAAYIVSDRMTPIYEATTTVLVKTQQSSLVLPGFDGVTGNANAVRQSTLEVLRSRTLALRTAERLGYDFDVHSSEFAAFRGSISVQSATNSDVIRISVQHEDPAEAQRIANALVETFIVESRRMNSEDIRAAREFVQQQLVQFETELERAEEELVRYKEMARIVTPSGETSAVLEGLTRLEGMRAEAYVALETAQRRLDALTGELAEDRRSVVSGTVIASDPLISSIRAQLASLEAQLAAAREQFTDRHPRVVSLQAQVDEYRQELSNQIARLESTETDTRLSSELISLQAEVLAQQARIEALDRMIAEREALLGDLPEKELHLTRLIRTASVTEQIYTLLLQRYEELRINEAMESAAITVIDPAIEPRSPVKPRKLLNTAIAGFLGLFMGVGMAFLFEYLDTTFKTPEEIEEYLGLPILGRTPLFDAASSSKSYYS